MRPSSVHGWLFIDKPLGMTSASVVTRLRKLLKIKKIGHGGTLDPLATGVLPIALGEATKTVSFAMDMTKTYRFQVKWGESRTTDDSAGEVEKCSPHRPTAADILSALPGFIGEIQQVPPQYSAIKVDGVRAYKRARGNELMDLKPRPVKVDTFSLLEGAPDHAWFEVVCHKGTYVRSLARDLAEKLGTYGHVTQLIRVRVGKIDLLKSISLAKVEKLGHNFIINDYLFSIEEMLSHLVKVVLSAEDAEKVFHGRAILAPLKVDQGIDQEGPLLCLGADKLPLALAQVKEGWIHPLRGFRMAV